ncbi:hypothetical protein AB205_0032370 [Aquarana catesbeiana]|uniref:Uncharacterized protein n=1 Tax=Aquarana catesbeiana TaxID=8400 RepID=A0A2G9S5S4_AQUCT|nr:hypothetical protein AB205_0032370 [Aquarana catesbeiana]
MSTVYLAILRHFCVEERQRQWLQSHYATMPHSKPEKAYYGASVVDRPFTTLKLALGPDRLHVTELLYIRVERIVLEWGGSRFVLIWNLTFTPVSCKALGLRRDDTFSVTMLGHCIEMPIHILLHIFVKKNRNKRLVCAKVIASTNRE